MDDPQKKHIPITVAMSGGVDSTVTAVLLKQQGHPVAGVFLALAQPDLERQVDRVSRIAERNPGVSGEEVMRALEEIDEELKARR